MTAIFKFKIFVIAHKVLSISEPHYVSVLLRELDTVAIRQLCFGGQSLLVQPFVRSSGPRGSFQLCHFFGLEQSEQTMQNLWLCILFKKNCSRLNCSLCMHVTRWPPFSLMHQSLSPSKLCTSNLTVLLLLLLLLYYIVWIIIYLLN